MLNRSAQLARVRSFAFRVLVISALAALFALPAAGGEGVWRPGIVIRFGNVDGIDAEDGELAKFLRQIRNDGVFQPPLRNLVGPAIRNPTFFGLVYETWMEAVVQVPPGAGALRTAWVFPVENRDEYIDHLSGLGLAEFENMEGMTLLREVLEDGTMRSWYIEWLPGDVAVFGSDRDAVAATRRVYVENTASKGLLGGGDGRFLDPDLAVRIFPPVVIQWQNEEPGRYWWRSLIDSLRRDLAAYWRPSPSRARLMAAVAEVATVWPAHLERVDWALWMEESGPEWRFEARGDVGALSGKSQLECMRRLPERVAFAYGQPVTPEGLAILGSRLSELIAGAAGGLVSGEARAVAAGVWATLASGGPRQMAAAWIPPPSDRPELGGARMLVVEWLDPLAPARAWDSILRALDTTPVRQAFSQLGWRMTVSPATEDGRGVEIAVYPLDGEETTPYYRADLVVRQNGPWMALVVGDSREDEAARGDVLAYRGRLAAEAVAAAGAGTPDVRGAFTRVDAAGASFMALFEPVRFLQLALIEAADWRPRPPDQHEPESTRMAREMLEFGSGNAWTAAGVAEPGIWLCNGGMSWNSLMRFAAALGVTEAIGFE